MATVTTQRKGTKTHQSTAIRFMQINLQHSRMATDNLMKLIQQDHTDIVFVQEPYLYQNKTAGITRTHRTYTAHEEKNRTAIIIANKNIDAVLIKQLSDRDTVVIEMRYKSIGILAASIYCDINEDIDKNTSKIDEILRFNKSTGILIAMDSNSRSAVWHDRHTNSRGKTLEEYLISRDLHIKNEESEHNTFHSRRGSSNIDLTIVNNRQLKNFKDWEISEDESCSDHNIIKFQIGQEINHVLQHNHNGTRYIVKEEDYDKFDKNLIELVTKKFQLEKLADIDTSVATHIKENCNIVNAVGKLHEAITLSCNKSFKTRGITKKTTTHKSVPWWTEDLTIKRKRLNALRRRYQRTKNNEELRELRKNIYYEEKANYQATIKKEKTKSWKEYCNLTPSTNPWNAIYKLATNKAKESQIMTTLQKPDGSLTSNLNETLKIMSDYLIPTDDQRDDTDYHKGVRAKSKEPILTADDREYTPTEVKNAIYDLKHNKAPGEDGITGEIYQRVYTQLPTTIYTIYNECLRKGCFPKKWKKVNIIPITKPGKEKSTEVSKFRPISLINVGGKVLEKLLINRIMHHIHSNSLMNPNQFGFTPRKSAIDAAIAVKEYLEEGSRKGHVAILVSLDVKGAFDAAWWPSILNTLKEFNCPKNLYNLVKSYFNARTAILSTNSIEIEREVSKGCTQGCCFWNIQYNSLLNIEYGKHTKAIAFADDLLIVTTAETVREAENHANIEIRKISKWAKVNKITFNEQKSQVMVISRRRRRENKNVSIYLNNKPLDQVNKIKYLGIIIDSKLTFREHLMYTSTKCTKIIHALAKSAKLSWGLKHEALNTIYKGAILPLMLYGAPV